MKNTFEISREKVNIPQMKKTNQELIGLLNELYGRQVPNDEFTLDDVLIFCRSLISKQGRHLSPRLEGAWCLQHNPYQPRMPKDAQIDFIHKTTYLAVSILTYVDMAYPVVSNQIEGYHEALQKGMRFSAGTNLAGHTYAEAKALEEFIDYFVKGNVINYLINDPDFCPELYTLLVSVKEYMGDLLQEKRYYDGFGNSQEQRIKAIDHKLVML